MFLVRSWLLIEFPLYMIFIWRDVLYTNWFKAAKFFNQCFHERTFSNYLHSSWSSNEVEAVDWRQNLDRRIKMGEVKMFWSFSWFSQLHLFFCTFQLCQLLMLKDGSSYFINANWECFCHTFDLIGSVMSFHN